MIALAPLASAVLRARRKKARSEGEISPLIGATTTSPLWMTSRACPISSADKTAIKTSIDNFFIVWKAPRRRVNLASLQKANERKINSPRDSIRNHRADRGRQRHRRGDRLVFSVETGRRKFQGALSLSSGENAFVSRQSAAPDISLLRLRRRRKRFPVRDGIRAPRFFSGRAKIVGPCWHFDCRRTRGCGRISTT